jgi:hypothetical protein
MNIQRIYVESENPLHHWNWLNVKDQVVLDLGCGFHFIQDGWDTTPEFFLKKGASKIIGLDPHLDDIEHFKQILPESEFIKDCVLSAEHLNQYLLNPEVQAVKMDIEGAEYEALPEILSRGVRPTMISMEIHSNHISGKTLVDLLEASGYKLRKTHDLQAYCTNVEADFSGKSATLHWNQK